MTEAFGKQIDWLQESSKETLEAAKTLFERKYYSHSLFLCHLSLEKTLKAIVMKHTGKEAPFIHDLRRLGEIAELSTSAEQRELFDIISNFHIAGRYPDQKFEFYKEYNNQNKAQEYINHTQELYSWLQEESQKKIIQVVRGYSERLEQQDRIPIEKVILFGSYAKGTPKKWSDVDICVISPSFTRPFEAMTLLWRKRNREEVLAGIEPVGFTPQDFEEGSSLINEIKRTGVDLTTHK